MRLPTRSEASRSTSRGTPAEVSVRPREEVKSNPAIGRPELLRSYNRSTWFSSSATSMNWLSIATAVEASLVPVKKRVLLGETDAAEAA